MSKSYNSFNDWLCRQQGIMPETAISYTVKALIPYTKANLKLAFHPNAFFNELEAIDNQRYSRSTLRKAYYKAINKGYITRDNLGNPKVSDKAKSMLSPYRPKKLKHASIILTFDIPERHRYKRDWFRALLRELHFKQIQRSVWASDYDCLKMISAGILEQRLEKYIKVYEAKAIESL